MESNANEFSWKMEVFEWLDTAIKTMVPALLIFTFVISLSTIKQISMYPTLQEGDRVLIWNLFYKPKQKDIVIITKPNYANHQLVKRVIATDGQVVDLDPVTNKVIVDEKVLDEPYTHGKPTISEGVEYPHKVEGFHAYGDNRPHSWDSRSPAIGDINEAYAKGQPVFRIWPLNRFGFIEYNNIMPESKLHASLIAIGLISIVAGSMFLCRRCSREKQ